MQTLRSTRTEILPSSEQLETIIAAALTAPSGDNCQPWTFHWDGASLLVRHDAARGEHALNRRNHASRLTLGCLLEALDIAALAEGFQTTTALTLEHPADWAKVSFQPAARAFHPLRGALEKRATDRRIYRGGNLRPDILAKLRQCAGSHPPCSVYFANRFGQEFMEYLEDVEEIVWRLPYYHRDLMRWIRFSGKEAQSTRDGMPWRTLGVNYPESRGLKLARRFSIQKILNKLGFIGHLRRLLMRQVQSSAALYCLTVRSTDPHQLVAAGRLALSLWLELTEQGYAVQPLTIASLSVYDFVTGALPEETPSRFKQLFAAGRGILMKTFGFSGVEIPVWMFRTGQCDALPRQNRCYRLPVDQVLRRAA